MTRRRLSSACARCTGSKPPYYSIRREILAALADLQGRVDIFIAGHGYYNERTRMGYLVTYDSKSRAQDRFFHSYLSHNELANFATAIGSRHTLVILDACFDGTFADRGVSTRGGDE
jgi:hypothetical protein